MVGLPKIVQSDQGSNFTSRVFRQAMNSLGIKTVTSSAYHPQSQGALERFHSTWKPWSEHTVSTTRKIGMKVSIPHVCCKRCTTRVARIQSIRTNVWTHCAWTPIHAEREMVARKSTNESLLENVPRFQTRLQETCELARKRLKTVKSEMKIQYDRILSTDISKPVIKYLYYCPYPVIPLRPDSMVPTK